MQLYGDLYAVKLIPAQRWSWSWSTVRVNRVRQRIRWRGRDFLRTEPVGPQGDLRDRLDFVAMEKVRI